MKKVIFLCLLFGPSLSFAQKIIEKDLGPLSVVEREFQVNIEECGRHYIQKDAYSGECTVDIGAKRTARLMRYSPLFHTWHYNSGDMWQLYVSLYITSQGYKIKVQGEPPMPRDRASWAVAEKYVRRMLEEYGKSTIKSLFLRPQSELLTDEVLLGPLNIFERQLKLNAVDDYFSLCEERLKQEGSGFICQLGFVSSAEGESVISSNSQQKVTAQLSTGESIQISYSASQGWQYSGPFSSAYYRVEYQGIGLSVEQRRELYEQALGRRDWKSASFLVHRAANQPKNTKLFGETHLGRGHLLLREVELDLELCRKNWRANGSAGECAFPLQTRGVLLSESIYPFQGMVKIANETVYIDLVLSAQGVSVRVYGAEAIVSDFSRTEAFLQNVKNRLPGGMITSHALIW